jgi:hypothetical protein
MKFQVLVRFMELCKTIKAMDVKYVIVTLPLYGIKRKSDDPLFRVGAHANNAEMLYVTSDLPFRTLDLRNAHSPILYFSRQAYSKSGLSITANPAATPPSFVP